ncbi:MAG: hypothetical protein JWR26_3420 [Pedosphaera sp.]|nr:hypothetical protein [Pedosphaera sp.]
MNGHRVFVPLPPSCKAKARSLFRRALDFTMENMWMCGTRLRDLLIKVLLETGEYPPDLVRAAQVGYGVGD